MGVLYNRKHKYVWVGEIYHSAKKNAKVRGIPFELSMEDFHKMVERCNNECEVTGIPFEFSTKISGRKKYTKRPYIPSIDRISSSDGYSKDNCRIVCCFVNLALGMFGREVFDRTCREYVRNNPQ